MFTDMIHWSPVQFRRILQEIEFYEQFAKSLSGWMTIVGWCDRKMGHLLLLFIQFSDLMMQSLGKIFVSPLSSVAQIGVLGVSSVQFVLQPFVSNCALDKWMVINNAIAEIQSPTKSLRNYGTKYRLVRKLKHLNCGVREQFLLSSECWRTSPLTHKLKFIFIKWLLHVLNLIISNKCSSKLRNCCCALQTIVIIFE